MQALCLEQFAGLDALALGQVPRPAPGPGEVLIEVHAASVSPLDLKVVQGQVPAVTLPRIPGRDFAGKVIEGPSHLQGQAVWGTGGGGMGITRDGSHAQYLVRPAAAVAILPPGLSVEPAAAVGVSFTTAWLALVEAAALQAGETVLIVGAGGSVGDAAIQIARWRGARVLGADRRPPQRLEAADFVDTTPGGWDSAVRERTAGRGADAVFDLVGGDLFETSLRCLRHGGRSVVISSPHPRRVSFDLMDFYHQELTLRGVDSLALTPERGAELLAQLAAGFATGALQPPPTRAFALSDVRAAYLAVAAGTQGEKIVLTM